MNILILIVFFLKSVSISKVFSKLYHLNIIFNSREIPDNWFFFLPNNQVYAILLRLIAQLKSCHISLLTCEHIYFIFQRRTYLRCFTSESSRILWYLSSFLKKKKKHFFTEIFFHLDAFIFRIRIFGKYFIVHFFFSEWDPLSILFSFRFHFPLSQNMILTPGWTG